MTPTCKQTFTTDICDDFMFGLIGARVEQMNLSPCLVPTQNPKKYYSSYHIECLRPVHGVLNVDEKKLITQFDGKLRDERFEAN